MNVSSVRHNRTFKEGARCFCWGSCDCKIIKIKEQWPYFHGGAMTNASSLQTTGIFQSVGLSVKLRTSRPDQTANVIFINNQTK